MRKLIVVTAITMGIVTASFGMVGCEQSSEADVVSAGPETDPSKQIDSNRRQDITVLPDTACVGDTITISGRGARPDAEQKLRIIAENHDGSSSTPMIGGGETVTKTTSDPDGNWTLSFTIPGKAHLVYGYGGDDVPTPAGSYAVQVNFNGGARMADVYGIGKFTVGDCGNTASGVGDTSTSADLRVYAGLYVQAGTTNGYQAYIELSADGKFTVGFFVFARSKSREEIPGTYEISGNVLKLHYGTDKYGVDYSSNNEVVRIEGGTIIDKDGNTFVRE